MTLALVWQTFHEAFTAVFFQNAKFTKLFRICSCFSEVVRTSSTSKWHFVKIRQFTKQKRTVITEKVFGVTRRLHSNGFAGISFPKLSKFVFSSTPPNKFTESGHTNINQLNHLPFDIEKQKKQLIGFVVAAETQLKWNIKRRITSSK